MEIIVEFTIPRKTRHVKSNASWETQTIRHLAIKKNKTKRQYLSDKSDENKRNRNAASKELKKAVKKAVVDFEGILATNTAVEPFWHYVKSKYKVKMSIRPLVKDSTADLLTDSDEDCANTFSKFYSSVFTNENVDCIPFAVPFAAEEFVDVAFSEELVLICPAKTKSFSSPGPNGPPHGLFKAGSEVLIPVSCKIFQFFFDNGNIPMQ